MDSAKISTCETNGTAGGSTVIKDTMVPLLTNGKGSPDDKEDNVKNKKDGGALTSEVPSVVAVVCSLSSSFCLVVCKLPTKLFLGINPLVVSCINVCNVMAVSLLLCLYRKYNVPTDRTVLLLLLLRSVLGGTSYLMSFISLNFLSLPDNVTVVSSKTIIATVMAHFILGEEMSIFIGLMALVTSAGIVLIVRPPFLFPPEEDISDGTGMTQVYGVLLALSAAIFASLNVVIARKLRNIPMPVLISSQAVLGVTLHIAVLYFTAREGVPAARTTRLILVAFSFTYTAGKFLGLYALKKGTVGFVQLIKNSDVLFGFVIQLVILRTTPHWTSVLGAAIIVMSVVTMAERHRLTALIHNCTPYCCSPLKLCHGKQAREEKEMEAIP